MAYTSYVGSGARNAYEAASVSGRRTAAPRMLPIRKSDAHHCCSPCMRSPRLRESGEVFSVAPTCVRVADSFVESVRTSAVQRRRDDDPPTALRLRPRLGFVDQCSAHAEAAPLFRDHEKGQLSQ